MGHTVGRSQRRLAVEVAAGVESSLPRGTLIFSLATPLGPGGNSEQMVSLSAARCAARPTLCGAQGSLVPAAPRPSHARERPQRSVRLGSVRTRGKPEVKGWKRKTRVPGGARRPASCLWRARSSPSLDSHHLAATLIASSPLRSGARIRYSPSPCGSPAACPPSPLVFQPPGRLPLFPNL